MTFNETIKNLTNDKIKTLYEKLLNHHGDEITFIDIVYNELERRGLVDTTEFDLD